MLDLPWSDIRVGVSQIVFLLALIAIGIAFIEKGVDE